MRKLLLMFLTMSIIITSGLSSWNYTYCNEYILNAPLSEGEKVLQKYLYKDLDNLNNRIQILAKNGIGVKYEGNEKKINEYLKDIDRILSDINYLLIEIRQSYDQYEEDLAISNGILAMGIIASNFRLALTQMKEYLLAENLEEEYRTLGNYFKSISDAEKGLNSIKAYIPKP